MENCQAVFVNCLNGWCAGANHNLDLNLGISPPSLGNGSKEEEGCLQLHSGAYDGHSGRSFRVRFVLVNLLVFLRKPKFHSVVKILSLVALVERLKNHL